MKSGISLVDMAKEIQRQADLKADYMLDTRSLRLEPFDSKLYLNAYDQSGVPALEPLEVNSIAHRQIGTHLKIPAAYHAYLDLFRRGREAIENHPPTISEMALAIMRKVIRDLESDKREYEFSALTPEQQVVELQRAEQARKEWKAHIAQLREKQGRVLKSEDLEASQP